MELIFDVVKTREFNGGDNTEIVPMVIPVLIVITHHASVIATVQSMVDVQGCNESPVLAQQPKFHVEADHSHASA